MTQLQRITAKQKVVRLNKINEYYQANPGSSINQAVKYTPPNGESSALVQQYSKLRTELVIDGDHVEITAEDIEEYVCGPSPLRHKQNARRNKMTKEQILARLWTLKYAHFDPDYTQKRIIELLLYYAPTDVQEAVGRVYANK